MEFFTSLESQQELFFHSGRVVFACSANLTSLTWEIRAASNIRRFLRLTNRDAIGYQLTATVAYTSVTAEIIESFPEFKISSLLSIQIPIFPELISVQCNGNRVYMDRNRICKLSDLVVRGIIIKDLMCDSKIDIYSKFRIIYNKML